MTSRSTNNALPFAVACSGIATYAAMDSLMKGLSIELGTYNAMFWRTLIALLFSGALFLWKGSAWPTRKVIKLHLWRGFITAIMAYLFFWGLIYVPLAEAIALSFIAPLIAMYLARVLLHEPIGPTAILASVIGFSGAMVIVGGKVGGDYEEAVWMGIAAILISAVLYAYNLILQRQQAIVAKPFEIAFFQNGTVVALYALFVPFLAVVPPQSVYLNLFVAALFGLVSLLALSWAYARAEARILIPVEYTAFVWAAIMGWVFFGEAITVPTLMGTALIVAGCLMAARQ